MAPVGGMFGVGQLKLQRQVYLNICRHFLEPRPAPGSISYYVLLPEVPPDTRETNPLLRPEEYPKFSKINPDLCITGSAKKSIEFDVGVGNLMEALKETMEELTFEKLFDPIEKFLVPLNYAWATTKHLGYARNDSPFKEAFNRIHPQVENAKCQRWLNEDLFKVVTDMRNNSKDSLNEVQLSLLDKYIREGKINGALLSKKDRQDFMTVVMRLGDLKHHFRNKVSITAGNFSHSVSDFHQVAEFPKDILSKISVNMSDPMRGPWKFNLNPSIYEAAMTYCGDRMTRWNMWYAYSNRASMDHDNRNLSNHIVIKDILLARSDVAKYLGYPTFGHMSMDFKMAGNLENVTSFIQQTKQNFQPIAEEEVTVLQQFAKSEGFHDKLEVWDVPYWRRRHLDHLYKLDVNDLSNYFPLPRVLEFLFAYCRILFGLRFEDHTNSVDTWSEDVKFFKVYDDASNTFLSAFYLDPYSRPGVKIDGNWMESGRDRSDVVGVTPFSYFCLNLDKPTNDQPCLVTFTQLQQLFYQFGHGLQQLATLAPYSELSGQKNVEMDAVSTTAHLLQMILNTRQTLRTMSRHHITGEPLDEGVINTIMKRRHHMASYDNMINLYYSAVDLDLHTRTDKSWYSFMQDVWNDFVPIKIDEDDNHLCSFNPIFSENFHASYYSHMWSKMLACDIFETFRLASKESPESVRLIGKKYRDTFLSLGGSVPAAEVFRRFQGRDPNFDALVSYHLH